MYNLRRHRNKCEFNSQSPRYFGSSLVYVCLQCLFSFNLFTLQGTYSDTNERLARRTLPILTQPLGKLWFLSFVVFHINLNYHFFLLLFFISTLIINLCLSFIIFKEKKMNMHYFMTSSKSNATLITFETVGN